jgi:aspartate beta-hydroxylase
MVTGGGIKHGGRSIPGDRVAESVTAFLELEGAANLRHAHGRTLLDHLVDTYAILRRWNQPVWLQHAGLIHSVYGTDAFEHHLLALARRAEVCELVGEQAERLAYLFGVTPRGPLLAGTHRWTRLEGDATGDELDALVLVHMANLAEQAQANDGSPTSWLVRIRELADHLIDSETLTPPLFTAQLGSLSETDESLARRAYRAGQHELAAAVCPVIPEPCVWLAHTAGDTLSDYWAAAARKRLHNLGTAWDKRLSFEEWLQLTQVGEPLALDGGTDPRALFDAAAQKHAAPQTVGPKAGRERFDRYIETLTDQPLGKRYPDLESRPWHDPCQFSQARYLEAHAQEIRDELMTLDPMAFHSEAERIQRSGDWDVAFFYERGRRQDEICDQCPITTRGIEAYPAMRTLAGLIYVSRMGGGTHVQPHRGPTNLRVRCHLGIKVPYGDCAIRVGDETRRWEEGRCLVFDDYFEHEAWNHTDEDRIVLIVDLWHPDLSGTEIRLLEGLHRYASDHAGRLNRYWSANAAARAATT